MREIITQKYSKNLISTLANGQIKTVTRSSFDALEAIAERSNDYLPARVRLSKPELIGVDARDGTDNTRELSELGNAKRLADAHGGNLHFVPTAGAWLYWQGSWLWDDGAKVRRLAADLPSQIYDEGKLHFTQSDHFTNWSRASQRNSTINAAITLLKDSEEIRLHWNLVDADLTSIGIDNARQVVDLKTGTVRRAERQDYITKSLNVDWLGESHSAARWLSFLDQIFNGDQELINWLKRWCGYLLTGKTNEQIFLFCYGQGANGKSVFGETLRYILGDYARTISPETITASKRQAGGATPDLAELIGARLVLSSETEDGSAFGETLIKSMVAGDTMSARKLYCSQIEFKPLLKLMVLGNHKPMIKGDDYGIWRRVRMIPFTRTFAPEERDPDLLDKLKEEAPHIFAWMVEGCIEWQSRGLADVPVVVKQATAEYQVDQDILGRWIEESCDISPDGIVSSQLLYESYREWCEKNGQRPMPSNALGRKLSGRGYQGGKLNGARAWIGLSIKDSSSLLNLEVFN